MEPLLQKPVERGAVEREVVNQARLDPILAGTAHRTLHRRLALPEDGPAPGSLELLTLIRDEETAEEEEEVLLQAGLERLFT